MRSPPNSVLSIGLDKLAEDWLKTTRPVNEALMRRRLAIEVLHVSEALLLAPAITFSVYGENVVAPVLADRFGVDVVTQWVREGTIRFLLRDQVITSMPNPIEGLLPLQHGQLNSPAHCRPEESARMGVEGWSKGLSRGQRRELVRRVAKRTQPMPEGIAAAAAQKAIALAKDGALEGSGIVAEDLTTLDGPRHAKIREFAERLMNATLLTERELDLLNGEDLWQTFEIASRTVRTSEGLHEATTRILDYESLPNIPQMILDGTLPLEQLPRLRERPEVVEFRRWLWSGDRTDDYRLALDEYASLLSSLARESPDSLPTKVARISVVGLAGSALGAAAGTLVAGPLGTAVGGALGLGVSMFDGLLGDRILQGDNPRRLATDVVAPMVGARRAKRGRL